MPFVLIATRTVDGVVTQEELKDYGPYETGKEAAVAAAEVAAKMGCKVRPNPKKEVVDWRPKAQTHLTTVRRQQGPAVDFPANWTIQPIPDHFAYLTPTNRSEINFIASEDHGAQLRFTRMTVGRYLTSYYPELTDEVKKRMIASVDPRGALMIARTPDEVERVYDQGPSSCMAADAGRVRTDTGGKVHRARMYGGPDLAVAYVQVGERITARVVCWPDRKVYGRLYGDENRLKQLLAEEGYSYSQYFDGARISEVVTNVKGVQNGEEPIYHSSYFDNIRGLIVDDNRQIRAGNTKQIEDMQKGRTKYGLYVPANHGSDGRGGAQSIGVFCPLLNQYQPEKGFVDVSDIGGIKGHKWVSKTAADKYTFECFVTKKRMGVDQKVMVGTQTWSKAAFAEFGATCGFTGKPCHKDSLVTARDGIRVSKENLDLYHRNLDAKEAFARKIKDRVAEFQKNPTPTLVLSIDDLDERTSVGIRRYYEVVTGRTADGFPPFEISGREITIKVA